MNTKENMTLREVSTGESRSVLKVGGEGALRQRILDMGLTKGAKVTVRKVAPLGDPIEEAACIYMK